MDIPFQHPLTQRTETLHLDAFKLFAGMAAFSVSYHAQASSHILSALLANPQFSPSREPGESTQQAYARCACDYADALQTELTRREAKAIATEGGAS